VLPVKARTLLQTFISQLIIIQNCIRSFILLSVDHL